VTFLTILLHRDGVNPMRPETLEALMAIVGEDNVSTRAADLYT